MRDVQRDYDQLGKLLQRRFPPSYEEFAFDDFLGHRGDLGTALLYIPVFLPPLLMIDNMVFQQLQWLDLPEAPEETVRRLLGQGMLPWQIEDDLNWLEIERMFGVESTTFAEQEEVVFARFLARSWQGWLQLSYPDKTFVVTLTQPTEGDARGLTFSQRPP